MKIAPGVDTKTDGNNAFLTFIHPTTGKVLDRIDARIDIDLPILTALRQRQIALEISDETWPEMDEDIAALLWVSNQLKDIKSIYLSRRRKSKDPIREVVKALKAEIENG